MVHCKHNKTQRLSIFYLKNVVYSMHRKTCEAIKEVVNTLGCEQHDLLDCHAVNIGDGPMFRKTISPLSSESRVN
jgi:hypothetical protein